MSAIDFAQKNAGKRVIIPSYILPAGIQELFLPDGFKFYAQIVGYVDDAHVVVEFEDELFRAQCWPVYDDVKLVISRNDFYDPKQPMAMAVNYLLVKEIKKLQVDNAGHFIAGIEKPKVIPPTPYPSKCKICKAPARRNDGLTMCSNRACSSRQKLLKKIGFKQRKFNLIRCACGKSDFVVSPAIMPVYSKRGTVLQTNQGKWFKLICEVGHNHNINSDTLKINDAVHYLNGFYGIWNGETWDMY